MTFYQLQRGKGFDQQLRSGGEPKLCTFVYCKIGVVPFSGQLTKLLPITEWHSPTPIIPGVLHHFSIPSPGWSISTPSGTEISTPEAETTAWKVPPPSTVPSSNCLQQKNTTAKQSQLPIRHPGESGICRCFWNLIQCDFFLFHQARKPIYS